jgi:hypothetical protein
VARSRRTSLTVHVRARYFARYPAPRCAACRHRRPAGRCVACTELGKSFLNSQARSGRPASRVLTGCALSAAAPPEIHREQAPDETLSAPASEPAGWRTARRVLGRRSGTRAAETETGKQKRHGGRAVGHRGPQGPAAEARSRDPRVPEARGREVEPAQPRAGRDRGAHHGAPSPLRAASSQRLTTANVRDTGVVVTNYRPRRAPLPPCGRRRKFNPAVRLRVGAESSERLPSKINEPRAHGGKLGP